MTVFFSDLDHTLIYSHRRSPAGEKICVEWLNGRQQSFMTGFTYRFLTGNPGISVVPVTTRTEVQYRRLTCMDAMGVRYAILCNGGKLLAGSAEDPDWTRETLRLAGAEMPALGDAAALLRNLAGGELQDPEPYMVYARCADPPSVYGELCAAADPDRVCAAYDSRKVYLFCRSVDKGSALRRFRQRFPVDRAVAAGDSAPDLPMLNEADFALAPESIAGGIRHNRKYILSGEFISDEICARLRMMTEGLEHSGGI